MRDVASAILAALEYQGDGGTPRIYNCGADSENYTLRDIAEIAAAEVTGSELVIESAQVDNRSYRVNFERVRRELDFSPRYRVVDGVREIRDALGAGAYRDFTRSTYSNYLLMKERNAN